MPHRSCKLTSVLRDALGGNCKTVLVANLWPEERHMEETLSTLKFSSRVASIANVASINSLAEVSPEQALTACQAQLHDLRRELAMHDQLAGRAHVSYEPLNPLQKAELRTKVESFLDGSGAEPEPRTLQEVRATFELFKHLY